MNALATAPVPVLVDPGTPVMNIDAMRPKVEPETAAGYVWGSDSRIRRIPRPRGRSADGPRS